MSGSTKKKAAKKKKKNADVEPEPTRPAAAALVLADGSIFEGEHFGSSQDRGFASGEVVFNTALTGYQEVITDPSYAGQIISFTYPHIGNYGIAADDSESRSTFARGVIVRDLARRHSNWRAEQSLEAFLVANQLSGIAGLDTRRLTRLLRSNGSMPGAFGPVEGPDAVDLATLKQAAIDEPGTDGVDLVAQVTTSAPYTADHRPTDGSGPGRAPVIVAFDFGIKSTIVDHLSMIGTVEVVPASTTAAEVLDRNPAGVFLSNGPGDPTESPYAIATVAELVGRVPIFGICLGHQILCLAIGAEIVKLPFGHHGANHPVRDLTTGEVEITSQNHNFAVDAASLDGLAEVTHVNLNDGVCEGMRLTPTKAGGKPAFSVQHHPEASPGPHDSAYLFDRFAAMIGA
ncbi:MAG: glutamine-hydrolyzing carbamoyl-phosphate synthase small subunit [Acidimicrobiales bacterium]